jgi:hypothetical protein
VAGLTEHNVTGSPDKVFHFRHAVCRSREGAAQEKFQVSVLSRISHRLKCGCELIVLTGIVGRFEGVAPASLRSRLPRHSCNRPFCATLMQGCFTIGKHACYALCSFSRSQNCPGRHMFAKHPPSWMLAAASTGASMLTVR